MHVQVMHRETKIDIALQDQNVVQCDQCTYKCRLNIQLKKHKKSEHDQICPTCKFCGSKTDLEKHLLLEHGNKETKNQPDEPFPCNSCDLVLGNFNLLQEHMKSHTTPPQFKCRYCDFITNDNDPLQDHLVESHENIVILHSMAKQVDYLTGSMVELRTFMKALFENQNKIKQDLLTVTKTKPDPSSPTHQTSVPHSMPPLYSSVTRGLGIPPPPASSSTPATKATTKVDNILVVGDSISSQLHLKTIEFATDVKIRTAKAYSCKQENISTKGKHKPKFPTKNYTDVIANELEKDNTDLLLVQAGSTDITNLKTEGENTESNEYFEKETVESAKNLFNAVTSAVNNNPGLKKVVILKQTPRYDFLTSNTPGLKPRLSTLFNETLDQLGNNCTFKDKLVIGTHDLNCSGGILQARYRDTKSGKFDGVHMYGPSGQKAYTASVVKILNSAQLVQYTPPKYYDELDHQSCPQARYQTRQKIYQVRQNNDTRGKSTDSTYRYTVPTHNRFTQLGDYFPGNF